MPFKSLAQQRFMFSQKPEIAKKWAKKYGTITKPLFARSKQSDKNKG